MSLDIFSYAVLKNTIKNSGGGWPSDLPVPSKGGYGYTTEVANETELICKRPEADTCWSEDIEFPDELIIGESYEVTVNGVTGTYECFDDDGDPALGTPYATLGQGEPGKWNIYNWTDDYGAYIDLSINLRQGETATIIISSIEVVVENEFNDVEWIDSYAKPFPPLIVGESYEVTVNGVTGTYECFEDDGHNRYLKNTDEDVHGAWNIYDGHFTYEVDVSFYGISAKSMLRNGETATFIVKILSEVHHPVEGKYLPEGGVGWKIPNIVKHEVTTYLTEKNGDSSFFQHVDDYETVRRYFDLIGSNNASIKFYVNDVYYGEVSIPNEWQSTILLDDLELYFDDEIGRFNIYFSNATENEYKISFVFEELVYEVHKIDNDFIDSCPIHIHDYDGNKLTENIDIYPYGQHIANNEIIFDDDPNIRRLRVAGSVPDNITIAVTNVEFPIAVGESVTVNSAWNVQFNLNAHYRIHVSSKRNTGLMANDGKFWAFDMPLTMSHNSASSSTSADTITLTGLYVANANAFDKTQLSWYYLSVQVTNNDSRAIITMTRIK